LRWAPQGGSPVSPVDFIPLLEENGLIVEIGAWVLKTACAQTAAWHRQGLQNLRVSINISALQFMRSDLDVTVHQVLAETGLAPGQLRLELTESTIMIDSLTSMEKMQALTNTGITLSLDDFGTGYSSLEYLGRLPISEIKIDRSFVSRMMATDNDAAIVNTIIAMAHSLGMELVAEGVEKKEQLAHLRERNCQIIQGFLLSKPLPAQEFETLAQGWGASKLRADLLDGLRISWPRAAAKTGQAKK
jgi:EAL domain-containing protein (putative c-di-GMP-specific phosphodiesterase class I)